MMMTNIQQIYNNGYINGYEDAIQEMQNKIDGMTIPKWRYRPDISVSDPYPTDAASKWSVKY